MAAGLGFKTFTTGEVLTAADTNGYLMQGILVFATEAARNSAITSPQEGQFAFTKDTNSTWFYDGAAWVASGASGDVTGVTAGNGISVTSPTGPVPTVAIDTAVTVDKTTAQTLTNKTLTSPALTTPTISTATTNGDLLYGTGSGALARLGIGSTSQVLTVTGGVPVWATPSSSPTFHGGAVYANSQSIPDSTATAVAFPNEQFDTDGYHSTTVNTSRVTIPSGLGGYYYFTFTGALSANTAGNRDVFLRKNGSLFRGSFGGASAAGRANLQMNQILSCAVGDYIEIFVTQDSGTSLTLFENGSVGGASFNWTFLGA